MHIVIPADNRVMDVLELQNIEYILCYLDKCLKEEYHRRYQERGNAEEFMQIFVDRWDAWINSFEKRECKKYVMRQGEFLIDIIEKYTMDAKERILISY